MDDIGSDDDQIYGWNAGIGKINFCPHLDTLYH